MIFLFLALSAGTYLETWALKMPLGIIRPCANMAYLYYSDRQDLDRALYFLYWPCYRVMPGGYVHWSDRVYPSASGLGP